MDIEAYEATLELGLLRGPGKFDDFSAPTCLLGALWRAGVRLTWEYRNLVVTMNDAPWHDPAAKVAALRPLGYACAEAIGVEDDTWCARVIDGFDRVLRSWGFDASPPRRETATECRTPGWRTMPQTRLIAAINLVWREPNVPSPRGDDFLAELTAAAVAAFEGTPVGEG